MKRDVGTPALTSISVKSRCAAPQCEHINPKSGQQCVGDSYDPETRYTACFHSRKIGEPILFLKEAISIMGSVRFSRIVSSFAAVAIVLVLAVATLVAIGPTHKADAASLPRGPAVTATAPLPDAGSA